MKNFSGSVECCLQCPYLRCGTVKSDRYSLQITYCAAHGDPVQFYHSTKATMGRITDLIILDAEQIPGWCPLDNS